MSVDPWIQDGLSSHWTPEIRAWAAANNMELVPTPTYASYLNRIESTFGAIDEFVCKNAEYLDWDAFGFALADHVRTATARANASHASWKQPDGANAAPHRPRPSSRSPPER